MTNFLSTGESEYCECGHLLIDHEEDGAHSNSNIAMNFSAYYYECFRLVPGKCKCGRCYQRCRCNQFTPYRSKQPYSYELEVKRDKRYVLDMLDDVV